jgi:hypothetical protein
VAPPASGPPRGLAAELEELDARIQALVREKKLREASKILSAARGQRSTAEWTQAIDERAHKLEADALSRAAPILGRAGAAVRKGDEETLRSLRRELESMDAPGVLEALEKAVLAAKADPWVILSLAHLTSAGGATFTVQRDGSILVEGPNPERDRFTTTAALGFRRLRAFRIEALPDPSLVSGGPGRADNGNFVLTEFKVLSGGRPVDWAGASSDFEQGGYPSSGALDGNPRTGWAVSPRFGQASSAFFHLRTPVDLDEANLVLEFESAYGSHVLGRFRISATSIELPPPPGPRPAEATPLATAPAATAEAPGLVAWRDAWRKAARLARARDYGAATKVLQAARAASPDPAVRKEADGDLANFLAAAELQAEVPQLLGRWTKGSRIKLDYVAPDGMPDWADGTVIDSSPRGVTLETPGGMFEIPAGELGSGALADLVRLRGEKRAGDARGLALFSAGEGRLSADLPPKYAALRGKIDPREQEARSIFWKAEGEFGPMKSRGFSGPAYATLLEKHGQTSFVERNRVFLEDRLRNARDFFFFGDELAGGGHFAPVIPPKLDPYWLCAAEAASGKAAANFVEAEIQIDAGATYRGWVYAGGCCQEVFTFFLQGTGLSGSSAKNPRETVITQPGGEDWISVRPLLLSLKKKHSDHTGPRQPERWGWIDLGILKFSEPGTKKLRILTEEKGFAVAYLAVSAVRQGTPRDTEVKDLARNRPPLDLGPTGSITREIWRGVAGWQIADLQGSSKYIDGVPDEAGPISSIDSTDLGTNYGCRIRGFLHPPATGNYVFWISSDDEGELWLSADDHPVKKQKICGLSHAVGLREWDGDPSQKSQPVKLSAGQRYYIEVIQKQGDGPEHVAVGWQLPSGALERPIPGTRLSPFSLFPSRRAPRASVQTGLLEGPVIKSAYVGGSGGNEFEDVPSPRLLLRGFKYTVSDTGCIFSLQPLYTGRQGESEGRLLGGVPASRQVVARAGYAVGGMIVRGTDRLNAFKVIFTRISGGRLDGSERYESEWIGTRAGGGEVALGGAGMFVIGVFGRAAWEIDGAGLLLVGK